MGKCTCNKITSCKRTCIIPDSLKQDYFSSQSTYGSSQNTYATKKYYD